MGPEQNRWKSSFKLYDYMINVLNYTDQGFNTSQYYVNKSSENRTTKKELHFTIKITKSIKIWNYVYIIFIIYIVNIV